jgi:hypothetical protein
MKTLNAFQFNACPQIPPVLHRTQMEVVELCNARFRDYYPMVADAALQRAVDGGFTTIVELGAGCGPLTERMAADLRAADLRFIVCDLIPDRAAFRRLIDRFPGRVEAIEEPVDFSQRRDWGPKTLLLLSAAFHHVPVERRLGVLEALTSSAGGVMIFSTVRKTPWCLLTAPLVVIPSLLLPIAFWKRPGRLRRILWCWLLPLVPLMSMWDAVGGCLRQWSGSDWKAAEDRAAGLRPLEVRESLNVQAVLV